MNLPDGNGVDLLKRIIALRPELRGHVALVTGDPQEIDRLIAETGFPALAKPFRLEEAYALLQRIL